MCKMQTSSAGSGKSKNKRDCGSSPFFITGIYIDISYLIGYIKNRKGGYVMKGINEKARGFVALLLCFMILPTVAYANVVWPSLYIAEGLRSWYIILAGLIVEFGFIKIFAKEKWLKAIIIAFIMNTISTLVGIILIPVSGLLGEVILLPFNKETFHWSHWLLSYILAVLGNVLIEGLSIRFIFKIKKFVWWLFVANAISVVLCILVYGFKMGRMYL